MPLKWVNTNTEKIYFEQLTDRNTWLQRSLLFNVENLQQISIQTDFDGYPIVVVKAQGDFFNLTQGTAFFGYNFTDINHEYSIGHWVTKEGKKFCKR